jgi:hypothetical protein
MSVSEKHELVFQAKMNVYYHESAERDYSNLLVLTSFLSIVFSSAAFAAIGNVIPGWIPISKDTIISVFSLLITCLNGAVLALGARQKANLHSALKKRWIDVLSDIQITNESEHEKIEEITRRFYKNNAEEPPPSKRRLDKAYKAVCVSMGLQPVISNES